MFAPELRNSLPWLRFRNGNKFGFDEMPPDPASPVTSSTPASTLGLSRNSSFKDGGTDESSPTPKRDLLPFEVTRHVPWLRVSGFDDELRAVRDHYIEQEDIKIVAATWNVGGFPPPTEVDLDDWLGVHDPADIYVIGFQEIVAINPGTVLGLEDDSAVAEWEALLRQTLNPPPTSPAGEEAGPNHIGGATPTPGIEGHFQASRSEGGIQFHAPAGSGGGDGGSQPLDLDCDHSLAERREASLQTLPSGSFPVRYVRVASKQMVGIHVGVWVRADVRKAVGAVKVSCVGTGIMGMLGNKGSVAVSLRFQESFLCFVCAHLAAGEKEGDALRRTTDMAEILKRTSFPRTDPPPHEFVHHPPPETIKDHQVVILMGDLNYRLELPDEQVRQQIERREWYALLAGDQLRQELEHSPVLEGFEEGRIGFAPTYKYVLNSLAYVGDERESEGDKRRTPAWCDRVLWCGPRLQQLRYWRSELLNSDHRPVSAAFVARVDKVHVGRWAEAVGMARARLDAQQHKKQPQCQLAPSEEVLFGELRYGHVVRRSVELQNNSHVTAKFSIAAAPGGEWVQWCVEGGGGRDTLEPGESVTIHLEACVLSPSTDVQRVLEEWGGKRGGCKGEGELSSIQVVHLEGGGDLFICCLGTYLPSCWGLSLDYLSAIPGPLRSTAHFPLVAPTGTLPPVPSQMPVIPKEIQRMITHLLEASSAGPHFLDAASVGIEAIDWEGSAEGGGEGGGLLWREAARGLEQRVSLIRDALDMASEFPPGIKPQLVGCCLILLLRALPDAILNRRQAEEVESLEWVGRVGAQLEREVEGSAGMVLDAVLSLVLALLRNRIANKMAIQQLSAVLASAFFPQDADLTRKRFRRRMRYCRALIEERLKTK